MSGAVSERLREGGNGGIRQFFFEGRNNDGPGAPVPSGEYRNDGAGSQFIHHEAQRQVNGNSFAREKACTADFCAFPAPSEAAVQDAGRVPVEEHFIITAVGGVAHQDCVLL